MADKPLTNDLVADPSLYRLGLQLGDNSLDIVLASRVSDSEPVYRHIDLTGVKGTGVSRLEEAVYDNPLLTADFGKVDFVIDTNRFFLVPAERAADPDALQSDISLIYPDTDTTAVVNYPDPERTAVVTLVDPALARFVGRTFPSAAITNRLAAVARYHVLRGHLGNSGKLHVALRADSTDIVAIGHRGLLMANTFATPKVEDAVYYTLAAARELEFDNTADRILVSGPRERRDTYVNMLRQYVTFAMPEIFPPVLSQNIPFALAAIPLCE